MNEKETTGFVGLTHLGIVSSICWGSKFKNTIGVDSNYEIIKKLSSGKIPIQEPKLQNVLDKAKGNVAFTTDFNSLSNCNIVFITQDMKTDEENRSDYKSFYNLIDQIIPNLTEGCIIVLMSQISVGTSAELKKYIKKKRPNLDFKIIYMVETLIIGNAVDRFLHPERIIIGIEPVTKTIPINFKKQLEKFDAPLVIMRYESAELTKLAINFYLFNSVTYANTLSDLCEAYSADMNEIIPALRLDKRIGPYSYIQPGLGIAGGNLERDMMTLIKLGKNKDLKSDLIELLVNLNKTRYKWVEKKLKTYLFPKIKKPKICLWGLAYKRDTNSLKNALSIKIIDDLSDSVDFNAYDPLVKKLDSSKVKLFNSRYNAAKGVHCLIILTNPDEFKELDSKKLKKIMEYPLVIDCVNIYSNYAKKLKDFKYIVVGKADLV
jgi:UDPglucose 6-dehydrogenase